MKDKLRELGLAGLGLGVAVKETVQRVGKKLVRKGEAQEKRILTEPRERLAAGAQVAGKEALALSRKSLHLLERELKKLEARAKKAGKRAGTAVKRRVAARLKAGQKKKRR